MNRLGGDVPDDYKLAAQLHDVIEDTKYSAARAITRGPRVELSDSDHGELHSPLRLQLRFKGFGGATIKLESLRATYLKQSI